MFLSRSTERQAGNDGKTVDSQQQQKKPTIFLYIFWISCIFRVYLFSRMTFKRKFRVYLILRNRPKFAKIAKICTREN